MTVADTPNKPVVRRNRKYRMALTEEARTTVNRQSDTARALWNLLHVYHEFYSSQRRWPSWRQMDDAIRQARHEVDWLAELPAQAAQQVLRHYRRAWENHWRGTHGKPTWKKHHSRRAVDVPQISEFIRVSNKWATVKIPKVGVIKIRLHQSLSDRITGARMVREADGWYLVVRGEELARYGPVCNPDRVLGLDRGVVHTLADNQDRFYDMPCTLSASEKKRLYRLERKSARQRRNKQRGTPQSNRERSTYVKIARLKARQARRRNNWAHQTTTALTCGGWGIYAIEALRIQSMTSSAYGTLENPGRNVAQKAGLNRVILDQGWGQTGSLLTYKAEAAGGRVVRVNPAYTSQTCHRCGNINKNQRENQARFVCQTCGWTGNADTNAAHNIAERGRKLPSQDVEPIAEVRRAKKRQPKHRSHT